MRTDPRQSPAPAMDFGHSDSTDMEFQGEPIDAPRSDDDDPLEAGVRMMPLRDLTRREEEARLVLEGHAGEPERMDTNGAARSRKRAAGESKMDSDRLVRRKGDLSKSFADPVQMGLCAEAEGRALFAAFVLLVKTGLD
jgi:hypothetical protein